MLWYLLTFNTGYDKRGGVYSQYKDSGQSVERGKQPGSSQDPLLLYFLLVLGVLDLGLDVSQASCIYCVIFSTHFTHWSTFHSLGTDFAIFRQDDKVVDIQVGSVPSLPVYPLLDMGEIGPFVFVNSIFTWFEMKRCRVDNWMS